MLMSANAPHARPLRELENASEFVARHIGIEGEDERRMLSVIGLVLAHASLVTEMTGITPLLLLDEVVAHLDPARRTALFEELKQLGAQVWMTGADPASFADIGPSGEIFAVNNGRISRHA